MSLTIAYYKQIAISAVLCSTLLMARGVAAETEVVGDCNVTNVFARGDVVVCPGASAETVKLLEQLVSEIRQKLAAHPTDPDEAVRLLRVLLATINDQAAEGRRPKLSLQQKTADQLEGVDTVVSNSGGFIDVTNVMVMNYLWVEILNRREGCKELPEFARSIPIGADGYWRGKHQKEPAGFRMAAWVKSAIGIRSVLARELKLPEDCVITSLEPSYVGIAYSNFAGVDREAWWRVEHNYWPAMSGLPEKLDIKAHEMTSADIQDVKERYRALQGEWGTGFGRGMDTIIIASRMNAFLKLSKTKPPQPAARNRQ